jgi:hypothetical protein
MAFAFALHSMSAREFIRHLLDYYNCKDIVWLESLISEKNKKVEKSVYCDIKDFLKTYGERCKKYREYRIMLLSESGLEQYKKYAIERPFFTKEEKYDLMIQIWKDNKDISLENYTELITLLCFPADIKDFVSLRDYFDVVFAVSRYINPKNEYLIKLFLLQAQDFYDCLEDCVSINYLFEFYPFTDSSIEDIIDWITGKKFELSKDGKKLYDTDTSTLLFYDSIINAIVPQKYDLEKLMIKRWIQKSNEQLIYCLGNKATDFIVNNLDELIMKLPHYSDEKFELDTNNFISEPLSDAILEGAPLLDEMISDLRHLYFTSIVGDNIVDNSSISSFCASDLRTKISDVTIKWEDVEFFNSYINIKYMRDDKTFTFTYRCQSSVRINDNIPYEDLSKFPQIHCAVNEYGILSILNSSQVDKCVAYLNEISRSINSSHSVNVSDDSKTCDYLLSLKNKCYNYLLEERDKHYPIKLIKEKCYTHSGVEGEEDAAIFVVKEVSEDKLLIVYENVRLARSTYVFLVEKDKANEVTNAIAKYFTSSEHNKRQHLINDVSVFERSKGFISFKRVSHASFETWRNDISYI